MSVTEKKKVTFFKFKANYSNINIEKASITFIAIIIVSLALQKVLHTLAVELYEIKNIATEDVDFTDIYYYNQQKPKTKNVVLINIGSLPADSLRYKLTQIIPQLNQYNAKAIGLDMYFSEAKDKKIDQELDSLLNDPKIVIGMDKVEKPYFPLGPDSQVQFGYINLPSKEGETVREFYNYFKVKNFFSPELKAPYNRVKNGQEKDSVNLLSFPRKLSEIAEFNNEKKLDMISYLRYQSVGNGYYNAFDENEAKRFQQTKFPAIEANLLLLYPEKAKAIIEGKIVILGWLGADNMYNPNDITDRHRVPVDFKLFNREPIMPGAVIFANAIEMMSSGDPEIKEVSFLWQNVFVYIILALYWIVFIKIETIAQLLPRFIIEISFIICGLFFIIKCGIWLMQKGYHIRLGSLLLHIALLIEFKLFAFHYYDDLCKKEWSIVQRLQSLFNSKKHD